MLVPNCFDFSSFVISFVLEKCETSKFILLFQHWFGIQGQQHSVICIVSCNLIKYMYVNCSKMLKERKKRRSICKYPVGVFNPFFRRTMISLIWGVSGEYSSSPFHLQITPVSFHNVSKAFMFGSRSISCPELHRDDMASSYLW